MDSAWRKKRFGKSGNHHRWFQVPVASRRKQTSKRKSVQIKSFKKKSSNKKTQKKKKLNECVPGSMLKVFRYLGLQKNIKKFTTVVKKNLRFHKVVDCVVGFTKESPTTKTFNPVTDTEPNTLYLIQITSRFIGDVKSNRSTDNSHCISVFNNLIFDHNIQNPLPLTKISLNKCCVGGTSYVFYHCSRVVKFTPLEQTKRFILKNLLKKK